MPGHVSGQGLDIGQGRSRHGPVQKLDIALDKVLTLARPDMGPDIGPDIGSGRRPCQCQDMNQYNVRTRVHTRQGHMTWQCQDMGQGKVRTLDRTRLRNGS